MPSEEMLGAMAKFNEEMVKGRSHGRRRRFAGKQQGRAHPFFRATKRSLVPGAISRDGQAWSAGY